MSNPAGDCLRRVSECGYPLFRTVGPCTVSSRDMQAVAREGARAPAPIPSWSRLFDQKGVVMMWNDENTINFGLLENVVCGTMGKGVSRVLSFQHGFGESGISILLLRASGASAPSWRSW